MASRPSDGPFAEGKSNRQLLDYRDRSREEAIECFERAPIADGGIVEVRRFFEMPD